MKSTALPAAGGDSKASQFGPLTDLLESPPLDADELRARVRARAEAAGGARMDAAMLHGWALRIARDGAADDDERVAAMRGLADVFARAPAAAPDREVVDQALAAAGIDDLRRMKLRSVWD